MIEKAKVYDPGNSLAIRYFQADANKIEMVESATIDLVYSNMVLMDIDDAEGAIAEVGRVLRPKGRFVANICHPCFDVGSQSGWFVDKDTFDPPKIYRKVRGYRNTFSDKIPWRTENNERRYTIGFHRPISWYAKALRKTILITAARRANADRRISFERAGEGR